MRPIEERIPVWLAAMDVGYLSHHELVRWADQEICRSASAPSWLPDLCLSRSQEEAEGILRVAWSRHQERDPSTVGWLDSYNRLAFGFLWLRFERGDLPLADTLEEAWDLQDASGFHDCRIDWRLGEAARSRRSAAPQDDLVAEARRWFRDVAAEARERLPDLPN
ncbi:MAG TPA: hypothetical protein VF796_31190 [Humisphaera sp.]